MATFFILLLGLLMLAAISTIAAAAIFKKRDEIGKEVPHPELPRTAP